jgi:hypothetical protein
MGTRSTWSSRFHVSLGSVPYRYFQGPMCRHLGNIMAISEEVQGQFRQYGEYAKIQGHRTGYVSCYIQ